MSDLIKELNRVLALAKDLKARGCETTISFSLHVPVAITVEDEEADLPPNPHKPRATHRTVQWALNLLRAANGQPNQPLIRKFLFQKGWIGSTDEPEAWNLETVPTSRAEVANLLAELTRWEKTQPKPKNG